MVQHLSLPEFRFRENRHESSVDFANDLVVVYEISNTNSNQKIVEIFEKLKRRFTFGSDIDSSSKLTYAATRTLSTILAITVSKVVTRNTKLIISTNTSYSFKHYLK